MMEMSRSKQDELLLEARIEKIRKKNEEIKRRHLEVEADKQHAAKLNALVKMTSPTEDWPIGGKLAAAGEEKLDDIRPFERNPEATEWPPKRSKSPQRNQAQARPRRSEPYKSVQNVASGNIGGAKCFNLGQGDGPPPDPKYKFLADSERDGDINISPSDRRQTRPSRGRGSSPGGDSGGVGGGGNFRGGGRGASRRGRPYRGGCQSHGESEPSHAEYEAWRAERNRIDNDRINRQKTAEGHWRREWDNEKISQEDDEPPMSQVSRFSGPRRGNSWGPSQDYSQHTTHSYESPKEYTTTSSSRTTERGRGSNTSRGSRGILKGRHSITSAPSGPTELKMEESMQVQNERNVVNIGESIKISVSNDPTTPTVRRVKVHAPVVGGTGRVGPRQKVRLSYSSQSEDEASLSQPPEIQPKKYPSSKQSSELDSSYEMNSKSSKPPLPPSIGHHTVEAPKPRRTRGKRMGYEQKVRKHAGKKESDSGEETGDANSKGGNESGGDDSWEDVTTTSGTESACEELSPRCNIDVEYDNDSHEKNETVDSFNDKQMDESDSDVEGNDSEFKKDVMNSMKELKEKAQEEKAEIYEITNTEEPISDSNFVKSYAETPEKYEIVDQLGDRHISGVTSIEQIACTENVDSSVTPKPLYEICDYANEEQILSHENVDDSTTIENSDAKLLSDCFLEKDTSEKFGLKENSDFTLMLKESTSESSKADGAETKTEANLL